MRSAGFAWLCIAVALWAVEPITPLPETVVYDRAKAELGKSLFFDPRLSKDRKVACVSCHDFNHGGADPDPVSTGIGGLKGRMNAPTVLNAVFNFKQFWNGRAEDLKDQAAGPIHNPVEMGMENSEVEVRLNADPRYRQIFREMYGTARIRFDDVVDAIAEFEKALVTPNARFDRFLRGEIALEPLEKRGYLLFKKLGCVTCHNGINIGGNSFQKIGAIRPYPRTKEIDDLYLLTGKAFDKNRFKVPTLRNIAETAPYFHDASAKTLDAAMETMSYHNLGFRLKADEKDAIVAFLRTLTGQTPGILEAP